MVLTREVSSVAVSVLVAERGCGRPSLLRLSDDDYDYQRSDTRGGHRGQLYPANDREYASGVSTAIENVPNSWLKSVHQYNAGHAKDLDLGESLLGSLLKIALKYHKNVELETVVGPPPRREGRHSMQAEQTESHEYLR
jgi:hypothetical protein